MLGHGRSIPGPGQVKIGQSLKLGFQSKIGVYLCQFLFEFIGGISFPVSGLQPQTTALKNWCMLF